MNTIIRQSLISLILSAALIQTAHTQETESNDAPALAPSEAESDIKPAASTPEKSAPDTLATRIAQLKAQYPEEDLISLSANGTEFSALWKKDQSGDALGAVLIVPSEGQTANWPNTIDVLRTELPQDGWNTLSIDIENTKQKAKISATPEGNESVSSTKNPNLARVEAAIAFLHEQGQYNIVLTGYGASTSLIVDYASQTDALGMNKTVKSAQTTNLKRPVRALILISALNYDGERLSKKIQRFPYKDMPILDIIFGSHYLDTFDSKERLSAARSARFKHYLQSKSVEPSSNDSRFGTGNRLSRRVRGFLDSYAKGVEIERR